MAPFLQMGADLKISLKKMMNSVKRHIHRNALHLAEKPPVRFNFAKLDDLSGHQKILLLDDVIRFKMPDKAIQIYSNLQTNGVIERLQYIDHHRMLHLMLKDIVGNKEGILIAMKQLQRPGFVPTLQTYALFVQCCRKWNDWPLAVSIVDEMLKKYEGSQINCWNDLFATCNSQKDSKHWMKGIQYWRMARLRTPKIEADASIYAKIVALHGKLHSLHEAEFVAAEAVSWIDGLSKRMGGRKPQPIVKKQRNGLLEVFHSLLLSYDLALAVLPDKSLYAKTHRLFQSMVDDSLLTEGLTPKETIRAIVATMIKICGQMGDTEQLQIVIRHAESQNVSFTSSMYNNIIKTFATSESRDIQTALQWYKRAMDNHSITSKPINAQKVSIAMIQAYFSCDEVEKANKLFFTLSKPNNDSSFLRPLRLTYLMMIEENQKRGLSEVVEDLTRQMESQYPLNLQ